MEAASEGENNRNSDGQMEGPKKPKRQMKTPYQLEILEKTYAAEMYPSEATRAELAEKLGLTDRQLQMWFCHRRLKEKKDAGAKSEGVKRQQAAGAVGKRVLLDPAADEWMVGRRGSDHVQMSGSETESESESGSGSYSGQFGHGNEVPIVKTEYGSPSSLMVQRVIACVEAQLGEPLRDDGPILGMEFDGPPPGAFGEPIGMTERRDPPGHSFKGKSFQHCDYKPIKVAMRGRREFLLDEPSITSDAYGEHIPSNIHDAPVSWPSAKASLLLHNNGRWSRGYGVEGQGSCLSLSSQHGTLEHLSPSGDSNYNARDFLHVKQMGDALESAHPVIGAETSGASDRHIPISEYGLGMEKKRKIDEARIGRHVEGQEKRSRKELDKEDILRRKREEQMRREMEKQEREKQKDEEKMIREKQRQQERLQREEKRELERREKFLQKESLRAERRRQKEELRREKEEARLKATLERATARKIAKESTELIDDERLELMELAASSKGLSSIVSLDHDTLQNLDSFRDYLCSFPPKSVQLKRPFTVQPWINSDENIGNLLMVWRFCITFADILGLWPFTLDEFVQAFHDYDSRLLGEINIAFLKLIIKDIENVARTPSSAVGSNHCSSANPDGGHPWLVEGAYLWGFDICSWKTHLNPLTWPEILRQFALAAGFGPQLKIKGVQAHLPDNDETKSSEDIVSTLRNGSAAENAAAIMQEKGFSLQRRSRHRLTPGTVKFAAYHVLSLEGNKGLTVLELAHKIQKSGLRDLTTSKTPEASISVALSRDAVLFERTAPSTYRVRPAFQKDPTDAEAVLSGAREKIKRYENGFLAGENADDVERDEESDTEGGEGPEVYDTDTLDTNKNSSNHNKVSASLGKDKDYISDDIAVNLQKEKEDILDNVAVNLQNEPDTAGTPINLFTEVASSGNITSNLDHIDTEIDESKRGEPWVEGLTEGEYSDLSVEERLRALVALVGIANEGNCIRAVLEDRLEAANALKKQMWAEAQLDKKRIKEESTPKFHCSSFTGNEAEINQTRAVAEGSQSPLAAVDNKNDELQLNVPVENGPFAGTENLPDHLNRFVPKRSLVESDASMGQYSSSVQQNGYDAERSRLRLKSYIGHRAEEFYVYRSLPLGQDRRRNRYWQFVASASRHDPGAGRIFVESADGHWRLIDSEKAFNALLASLDVRGVRESHLHNMLQISEKSFKENVFRNFQYTSLVDRGGEACNGATQMDCSPARSNGDESPTSTVSGLSSDTFEASLSFRIELGRDEAEKKAAMGRYQDFQLWMWKECFNSSTLSAMQHGQKRCRPLLGICESCLDSYFVENDLCPSCYRSFGTSGSDTAISGSETHSEEKRKASSNNTCLSNFSHPFRIRLLKALLTVIEVTVPIDAFQSSWTEHCRKTWGVKLHASSSAEALIQILTEFEAVIKQDCLSKNFETIEELVSSSLSGAGVCDSNDLGSVSQLPWIPQTSAAVALRLLELDGSISYILNQKAETHDKKEVENFPKLQSRYAYMKNIARVEQPEVIQEKAMKYKKRNLPTARRSSSNKQRVRGGTRGSLLKRVGGPSRPALKDEETLIQVLWQQLGRRRQTNRRRRTEKRAVQETLLSHLGSMGSLEGSTKSPRSSGEECLGVEIKEVQIEDTNNINSLAALEDDDDAGVVGYGFGKWGSRNSVIMSDEDVDGSGEDDNDVIEENSEANEDMSDNPEDNGVGVEGGSTESGESEGYID